MPDPNDTTGPYPELDRATELERLAAEALRPEMINTVQEAELRAAEAMARVSAGRTVRQLTPGEKIKLGPEWAVFVARGDHPIFEGLQLVTWRLGDGRWSHDALDADQHVGEAVPSSAEQRTANLRWALLNQGEVQVG